MVTHPIYTVGQLVSVMPRTAPGFNLEGGEGRIRAVVAVEDVPQPSSERPEGRATTRYVYDVRYTMRAATEKAVDAKWISVSSAAEYLAPVGHDPPAGQRRRSGRRR